MRILIAGGGGFVGLELARKLNGHELIIPSRDPQRLARAGLKAVFPLFAEDLSGIVSATRPEAVINLLGVIRETPGADFGKVHVDYTRALLAGAVSAGVSKFVQMSALGAAPDALSAYHRTKYAAEELVKASGLPYAILRPSYITGEGQALRAELKRLARFLPVFAAPSDALTAPLPVGTVAACLARAALDPAVRGATFGLGGERTVSFRELLASELAAAGVPRPVLGLPRRFFYPLLPLFALLPVPPMTREQYLMTARPNVPSGRHPGVKELN